MTQLEQAASLEQQEAVFLRRIPWPLIQIYHRASNAKNTLEMHQSTLALWEATLALQGALSVVLMPAEHWPSESSEAFEETYDSGVFASTLDAQLDGPLEQPSSSSTLESTIPSLRTLVETPHLVTWWSYVRALCSLPNAHAHLPQSIVLWVRAASCTGLPHCLTLLNHLRKLQEEPPLSPLESTFHTLVEQLDWYKTAFVFTQHLTPEWERFQHKLGHWMLSAWKEYIQKIDPLFGHRLVYIDKIRAESAGWRLECTQLQGEERTATDTYCIEYAAPHALPLERRVCLTHATDAESKHFEETVVSTDYISSWKDLHLFLRYSPELQGCAFFKGLKEDGLGTYLDYHSGVEEEHAISVSHNQMYFTPYFGGSIHQPNEQSEPFSDTKEPQHPINPMPEAHIALPKQIGEFAILSLLGEGGMGTVYRALQPTLGRQVAVKTLQRLGSKTAEQRFHREIQALGRIEHPHLIKIYTSGSHGHQWYYAMELIEGADVSRIYKQLRPDEHFELDEATWCSAIAQAQQDAKQEEQLISQVESEPQAHIPEVQLQSESFTGLPSVFEEWVPVESTHIKRMVELLRQVAQATHALHEAGVVHRDIKPGNIMITEDGKHAVLMDLGLARISDATDSHLTMSHQFMGTPLYASPEQCMGLDHVDRRTDIYSLGATLWEWLAFRPIFDFENKRLPEILEMIRYTEPQPLSRVRRDIPKDLEAIVLKCLEKDRDRRYPTAGLLAEDLARWLQGEPVLAQPPTMQYLFTKFFQRNRLPFLAVCSVVIAVLCAVLAAFISINTARKAAVLAQKKEQKAKNKALTARAQLFRSHRRVLALNTRLQNQKRAAVRAQKKEKEARKRAEESRKRLLRVQHQIVQERIQLLRKQKRLKRTPSNAILSFFTSVLQDTDNPLQHRQKAVQGISVLLERNVYRSHSNFKAHHLLKLIHALLQTINEPADASRSSHVHNSLLQLSAYSIVLLRKHIPMYLPFQTSHYVRKARQQCKSSRLVDGVWLSPVQHQLRCAKLQPHTVFGKLLALAQMAAGVPLSQDSIRVWNSLFSHATHSSSKRRTSSWIPIWKLRTIALEVIRECPIQYYETLFPTLLKAVYDSHKSVRIAALKTAEHWLVQVPKLGSRLLSHLHNILQKDRLIVREQAIQVVGQLPHSTSSIQQHVLRLLFQAAHDNKNYWKSWKIRRHSLAWMTHHLRRNPHLFYTVWPWVRLGLRHKYARERRIALNIIEHMIEAAPRFAHVVLPALIRACRDTNRWPRLAAFRGLRTIIVHVPSLRPKVVPYLLRGTRDRTHWVQTMAWSGLERWLHLGGTGIDLLPHISQAAQSSNAHVQEAALEVMETLIQRHPTLLQHLRPLLYNALNHEYSRIRRVTARILGEIYGHMPSQHWPVVTKYILKRLQDTHHSVQKAAIYALTQHPDLEPSLLSEVRRILRQESRHRRSRRRRTAFEMLKIFAPHLRTFRDLQKMILKGSQDPNPRVRTAAIHSLYHAAPVLWQKPWHAILSNASKDRSPKVRTAATDILTQAIRTNPRHSSIRARLQKAMRDPHLPVRRSALRAWSLWSQTSKPTQTWRTQLLAQQLQSKSRLDALTLAALHSTLVAPQFGFVVGSIVPDQILQRQIHAIVSQPTMLSLLEDVIQRKQGQAPVVQWHPMLSEPLSSAQQRVSWLYIRGQAAQWLGDTCHPRAFHILKKLYNASQPVALRVQIILAVGQLYALEPSVTLQWLQQVRTHTKHVWVRQAINEVIHTNQLPSTRQRQTRVGQRRHQACLRFARSAAHSVLHAIHP